MAALEPALMSAEAATSGPGPASRAVETPLVFTGRGSEYFRIWVVNTLLTLLTLGIYSAWAKVRRTRYLWRNTRLEGFAFDYHASPVAILRGRVLALVLFAAYTYAFDFSLAIGVAVLIALCAVGPWLFMRAQQFRLANTSWRGLRFGFDARTSEAYLAILPILVLWFWTTPVWLLVEDEYVILWTFVAALVPVPWMHHRLKAYQRRRAHYGDRAFSFRSSVLRFYAVYGKGVLVVALGFLASIAVMFLFASASTRLPDLMVGPESLLVILAGALMASTVFVFAWPYLAARLQQATWSATRLGSVRFHTRIRAGTLFGIVLRSVFLTLVTLGLYWPFAAMRLAKYRIECMRVETDEPLAGIVAGTHSARVGAGGEGAADAFGIDLGL